MELTSLPSQSPPIPLDLRKDLPVPLTPWRISDRLVGEMQTATFPVRYKKVQVLPTDAEWRFILRYFLHDKPTKYGLKGIYCVHESLQEKAFELNLSSMEREAETFPATWNQEPRNDQRAEAIKRWNLATGCFVPFQTKETDGRQRPGNHTKVMPLWHGSSSDKCESINTSGFAFFGKNSIGAKQSSDPQSRDEGYFGSGIYFTNSARYASDVYSDGHILLAWVSMREPFPVVGDPDQMDMKALKGKGAYKTYNAHYVPVVPEQPNNPNCAVYLPCKTEETPNCDEIVVFHKSQTLPRFWVELEVELPYLLQPSDEPLFVSELIPHLLKILQNPQVDRDLKLRNIFNKELSILLTLKADDDLQERHEKLFGEIARLIDSKGKVIKIARDALTGSSLPIQTNLHTLPSAAGLQQLQLVPSSLKIAPNTASPSIVRSSEPKPKVETFQTLHTDTIEALVELKDGVLASSSYDKTIKLWNRDGSCLATFIGHAYGVTALLELKNGSIISGSNDNTIKRWKRINVSGASCETTFTGHTGSVCALTELQDDTLASASYDGTIKRWNCDGSCLDTFKGHTGPVLALIECQDATLASGSSDNTIKRWRRGGSNLATLRGHTGPVCTLIQRKDSTLVSGSYDATIKIWSHDDVCLNTFIGHTRGVCAVIELKNGFLASASFDDTIKLWNLEGACVATLTADGHGVTSLIELKDGTLGIVSDNTIKIWTLPQQMFASSPPSTHKAEEMLLLTPASKTVTPSILRNWKAEPKIKTFSNNSGANALLELKDGTLATLSSYGINQWSREGTLLGTFHGQSSYQNPPLKLIELRDGTVVIVSKGGDELKLARRDGSCLTTLGWYSKAFHALIELRDGTFCASQDNKLALWTRYASPIRTFEGHTGPVFTLLELKDGTLVSGSGVPDPVIKLWTRDGFCISTLTGHSGFITEVIELNDSVIASASYDHTIKLWNRDGTCLATFKGHTSQVCAVIELKDGNLASSSYDGTIKIWGRDGSCLATLKENTGSFMSLIELNDGTLASASGSKVQLWTFPLIN